MPHETHLIATVAAAFGLAMLFGLAAARLKLPPLVGYLLAGILIGPFTPGFVADIGLAGQLAEIGVMLLMFGVGLHFSVQDLAAVRRIAVPGALLQIAVATLLGYGAARFWGWEPGSAVVFGLCLSVASTVVLLRALEARGRLGTIEGQIAVGWLVVEDLVMVMVLVLLPPLAGLLAGGGAAGEGGGGGLGMAIGLTLAKVAAFVALMWVVGRRLLPGLLGWVARTGSQELFTLSVVAIAVGVAFGAAAVFDVSFALGAFFAGMVMRESAYSHRAAEESLPLRDAFAVLFFVSVGMLFDPAVLWTEPVKLLLVVAILGIGKTLAAVALVLLMRYPLGTALTVGASLAQIGEFSFILAGLGVALGLLPEAGRSLVLAGALISIALNPALFAAVQPLERWLLAHSALARRLQARADPLAELPSSTPLEQTQGHVVVLAQGRLAERLVQALRAGGARCIVAESNREAVERWRAQGVAAVSGEWASAELLVQAHVARAAALVMDVSQPAQALAAAEIARTLNPTIAIVLRSPAADGVEGAAALRAAGLGEVFVDEEELVRGIASRTLALLPARPGTVPAAA